MVGPGRVLERQGTREECFVTLRLSFGRARPLSENLGNVSTFLFPSFTFRPGWPFRQRENGPLRRKDSKRNKYARVSLHTYYELPLLGF